ncbi:MAG TPA: hypothetical protein VFB51_02805 [Solirubrobacterales bacterium]|nr:hypothetical protein [Solirubrobacterales bacterium]
MHARRTRHARLAAAWALAAALLVPAGADAARRPAIEGRLSASYTVVALAPNGRARTIENAIGSFELVPPARTVTLHLLGSTGRYLGPLVVAGRGSRTVMEVRAGAKLGTVRVFENFSRPGRRVGSRRRGSGRRAKARDGVPIGAGVLGRVRSRAAGPGGPGRDRDLDGIPGRFDIDDDGDLVLDVRERSITRRQEGALASTGEEPAPAATAQAGVAGLDEAETALVVAIVAAVLALASLLWQAARSLRRRRAIEVEARLGLPVYTQGAGRWAVFIEVFNRTDHQVRWVSAALETKDGRIFYLMEHPPGGELPAVIQPHDSHHTWVDCHELERQGLPLDEPIVATAKLATGEIHRAPAKRLASRRTRLFG